VKTFTATQLNKSPQKVFAAIDKDGWANIKHDRYPENDIILMKRIKQPAIEMVNNIEGQFAGGLLDSLNSMFDAQEEYGCGFYDTEPWVTHYDNLRVMLGRKEHFNHGQ